MTRVAAIPLSDGSLFESRRFSISSHRLYELDSRLDAFSYSQGPARALAAVEACRFTKKPLGELCGTIWHPVQNQARSNFKRIYTKAEFGVPFVSSRSMFFFPLQPDRFLWRGMAKLPDLMVPEGWLLLSRSGTVGNVLFVNRTLASCAISDHAIRIEPVAVPAGYLYAFLATSFGQALISKSTYGSTVDELEPKHVAAIPVPLAPDEESLEIASKIYRAYELRAQGNDLLRKTERELHELLGISEFTERDIEYLGRSGDPRSFSVSSAELGIRCDATNHVPIARSVIHKISRGRFGLVTLGQRVARIYVAPRFARIYVDQAYGVPLLQGSQLPMFNPYGLKFISKTKTDGIQRWLIRKNWTLVTCSGTIGRIGISTQRQDGWAASQHILRVIPRAGDLHPGFITAYLSTPYGQHQLKARIYGGVVDEITEDDTATILVPDIPTNSEAFSSQAKLGESVVRAYEMRDEANAIEEEAVQRLERLIQETGCESA